ncbi:hypothetical protein [Pseudoalteromonas phage PH357]|nr:hypothetical protein [Pseudoalteromonas phage PH357]
MKKNNTLTIALTYENKDDSLVIDIIDNFASDAQEGCTRVYAVSREDLFGKVEAIEGILDDWESAEYGTTASDKVDLIREVVGE